ncbi:MAG: stage 0 sporulation family protein [Clostridia bacterium]|nr:stage 0 sporulation family protein [Clostridia bacterium]
MAAVVGVRFKNAGKLYYFDPGDHWPMAGSFVIVETARGLEYGQVITGVREVDDELIASPLKPVVRLANEEDARHAEENEKFEKEAYAVCQRKIDEHQLEMKLVGVEQTFDNSKILFYFTANGRVDFRALVKDLASVFRTRIELRQIGVRDEAKMLGGLGPCGRPLCCGTFLGDFQPVSIKMAKEQNLSLNPTKISGVCGRLMCCLKYEQDHYEATRKRMPKIGKEVETPDGFGSVVDLNILRETVTVRIFKGDSSELKVFPVEELKWNRPAPQPEREQTGEGKPSRRRATRPSLSSNPQGAGEAVTEIAEDAVVPEMEPVQQSNDWLRAVEEALNAAQKKN